MKTLIIALFILASVSCSQKDLEQRNDFYDDSDTWIVYASLDLGGRTDSMTGFPKFDVYRCKYCNKSESLDSRIEDQMFVLRDSMAKSPKNIEVLQVQYDSLSRFAREVEKGKSNFINKLSKLHN